MGESAAAAGTAEEQVAEEAAAAWLAAWPGGDLDAKDEAGWSALQRAAEAGQAVEQDGPTRTYPRMYGRRTDSAWPWHHCGLLRAGGS